MYKNNLQLSDLLQEMEFTDRARNLSTKTIRRNNKLLTMFFKWLDSAHSVRLLADVTHWHIREFLLVKLDEGNKESYCNVFLRSIRAFYVFCIEEDYVEMAANPCLRVKWLREQKPMIDSFSAEDVVKLLTCAKQQTRKSYSARNKRGRASQFYAERDLLMLLVLVDTGIRLFEVLGLHRDSLQEDGILIHGKGNKQRYVYCSSGIQKQFIKYARAQKEYYEFKGIEIPPELFTNKNGKVWTDDMVQRRIKVLAEKAGVDSTKRWSPHTFRHFWSQQQVLSGADVYTVQRMLGHSSVKTTETYLSSLKSEALLKKAAATSPLKTMGFRV